MELHQIPTANYPSRIRRTTSNITASNISTVNRLVDVLYRDT